MDLQPYRAFVEIGEKLFANGNRKCDSQSSSEYTWDDGVKWMVSQMMYSAFIPASKSQQSFVYKLPARAPVSHIRQTGDDPKRKK